MCVHTSDWGHISPKHYRKLATKKIISERRACPIVAHGRHTPCANPRTRLKYIALPLQLWPMLQFGLGAFMCRAAFMEQVRSMTPPEHKGASTKPV